MEPSKKSTSLLRYVVLPAVLILIIVSVLNFFIYKLELDFYYNIYNNEVLETTSLINRRFQSAMIAAESTGAFFASSEDVTEEEFDSFAGVLTKNIASGVISVPTIIEWVDKDNIIQHIYPVTEENKSVIGLDMNKYPNRLNPIITAKNTKSEVVSEPIMFIEGYPGMLIYSPVYKDSEYLGQVIVAIRLADLFSPIFGETPIYNKNEYIQTESFIVPFGEDVIFNLNGERIIDPQGDTIADSTSSKYLSNQNGVVSKNLVFADKTWQLKFSPTYISEVYKRAIFYAGISLVFIMDIVFLLWILQRRSDQLAKESDEHFKVSQFLDSIIENIPDMIFMKDAKELKFLKFNKAGEKLLGIKEEDMIGKSDYDFFPKSEAEFFIQKDRATLKNKELVDIPEEAIQTKNGLRLLHTKKIPILDEVGEPKYLLGISEDITERKGLQAKAEALIYSIGDGLMAMDKNGIITFVNKRAEDLSGYSAEDAIGKSYYDFWHLVDSRGVRIPPETRPFHQAIVKKQNISITVEDRLFILKKDGTRFPIASTISPIVVNEEVMGSIMVFRDITKESEVDRMKTEFLSLASHQLLTPSTSVKWISELLLKGEFGGLKKKQKEVIENIYKSNESMISLINSLLNVSRIESGRIKIEPKPTYLNEIVVDIIKELKNKIETKKQIFTLKSEKNLPKISVDPNLIREVYKNFLTNSIKYTPEKGKITVEISKDGENIISKVTDTGYGIPEKDKARVFEKFYRGENILSVEKDGNGLGLYLVKQIVEVSGGKVGFESKEGEGSTFWFTLPILGSVAQAGQVTVSSIS